MNVKKRCVLAMEAGFLMFFACSIDAGSRKKRQAVGVALNYFTKNDSTYAGVTVYTDRDGETQII
jgi:hypothetical protein